MRLSLGPLQYYWPRAEVLAFYARAMDWPVATVYLGETVCSKRRQMRSSDWLALAIDIAASGREVVLSSLALIEAESELGALERMVADGRFHIEANDISAVQLCREHQLPFVGGPGLNVYNHRTLRLLCEDGMRRLVLGVEQGRALLHELAAAASADDAPLPQLELIAWGRLPLSYSARCFTARARDVAKDECRFACIEHPDGLPLATREGRAFLTINGVQVQSAETCDLAPEMHQIAASGIDLLRLYPQAEGMEAVVQRWSEALASGIAPPRTPGCSSGYWHGGAAMAAADAGSAAR